MVQPEDLGRFFGSFIVTSVAEIIDKILGRKTETETEEQVIASVKDLRPLLDGLDYFKQIHNFMQNFLDNASDHLYGTPENSKLKISNQTKLRALHETWTGEFGKDFGREFRSLRDLLALFNNLGNEATIIEEGFVEKIIKRHTQFEPATRRAIRDIGGDVSATYERANAFILEITTEKTTIEQLPGMGIDQLEKVELEMKKWRKGVDTTASSALGAADHVLLSLIQILYFLYLQIPGLDKSKKL